MLPKKALVFLLWVVFSSITYLQRALLDCAPDADPSVIRCALRVSVRGCVCMRPVFARCQREMWQTVKAQVGFPQARPIDARERSSFVAAFSTHLSRTFTENERTRKKGISRYSQFGCFPFSLFQNNEFGESNKRVTDRWLIISPC